MKGTFRGIEVLKRGVSPRIVSAAVLGTRGDTNVSGPALAARLGLQSTWEFFSVKNGKAVTAEPDASAQPGPAPATANPAPSPPQGGAQAPGAPEATLAGGAAAG